MIHTTQRSALTTLAGLAILARLAAPADIAVAGQPLPPPVTPAPES